MRPLGREEFRVYRWQYIYMGCFGLARAADASLDPRQVDRWNEHLLMIPNGFLTSCRKFDFCAGRHYSVEL